MAEQARFTGQTYGEGARQQASQRVVPVGAPPGPGAAPDVQMPAFDRPTEFPDEPVTAGAMAPSVNIGIEPGSTQDLVLRVRAIASRYPNPALLRMLQILEQRNGMA